MLALLTGSYAMILFDCCAPRVQATVTSCSSNRSNCPTSTSTSSSRSRSAGNLARANAGPYPWLESAVLHGNCSHALDSLLLPLLLYQPARIHQLVVTDETQIQIIIAITGVL
jgi:hypothetical protein